MIYAIIGGIGSGKSTIMSLLREMGKITQDCDLIAKNITNEKIFIDKIVSVFGDIVKDNKIDRVKLGNIVFGDKTQLAKLNEIVHPEVKARLRDFFGKNNDKDIFVEVSTIMDSGFVDLFDKIICVTAPENIRINRVMIRSNYSEQQVKNIIKSQPKEQELIKISDYVIVNDQGNNNYLRQQLLDILQNT